jgi:hypothetical protein
MEKLRWSVGPECDHVFGLVCTLESLEKEISRFSLRTACGWNVIACRNKGRIGMVLLKRDMLKLRSAGEMFGFV